MTADEILDEVLRREGGYRAEVERPDGSVDPETMRGVTWPTYQAYCRRVGTIPTREGHLALSPQQAKAIYQLLFVDDPGFTPLHVPFEPLRVQLIDFGINSGPERAVRWLQRCMRARVTGQMDVATVGLLQAWTMTNLPALPLLNDALVAARSAMIDGLVDAGSVRRADEEGLESRALSFFLAKP